jgi:hypothetical protein
MRMRSKDGIDRKAGGMNGWGLRMSLIWNRDVFT